MATATVTICYVNSALGGFCGKDREPGAGSREPGAGSREPGIENREEGGWCLFDSLRVCNGAS
ncbi:hypothetical protein DP115_03095 [Brasilonema octagenarum UFV-OR1]|uniref:Uncharacterized protein n=1 Tax=Brasilonema octagenarum UFV-OR1 TaxID=417115 RepID=A0ABX1M719_9CYAN|nr:hypothetical protein [Brasilonema octagenarum UFV-OR1]